MKMSMRRLAVALTILVLLLSAAPVGASSASMIRLPRDAQDWETFGPAERRAALDYVREQAAQMLSSGETKVQTAGTAVEPTSGPVASGENGLVAAATPSVSARCELQWFWTPSGIWTRAGGWTDSSQTIYYLAASRQLKQGQLLRDGVIKDTFWQEVWSGDHAEAWTDYDFRWHFEGPKNYSVRSWHGAKQTSSGPWLIGPDAYCTLSQSI